MDGRAVVGTVAVLVASMSLAGSASARITHIRSVTRTVEEGPAPCAIHSLPSFMAQGEFANSSSIADIVEVHCSTVYAGHFLKLNASGLYSRCAGQLMWFLPYPYSGGVPSTRSFSAQLDNDGNATVVLWGGPSCAAGESFISAHLTEAPYTTVSTPFTVLAPATSMPGVLAAPASQVENEITGSVATIVELEFPPVYAGREVNVNDEQLYARCLISPHLRWVGPGALGPEEGSAGIEHVKLDNDGNAFVILLGGGSCAAGATLIEASLEQAPYTTYTTSFTVEPPQPLH